MLEISHGDDELLLIEFTFDDDLLLTRFTFNDVQTIEIKDFQRDIVAMSFD